MFTLHFSMEISRNLVFKNPLIPFPLPKVLVSPMLTYILELFVSKLTIIKKYLVFIFRKLCIKSSNEQNSFLSSNQALANFMGSITCGTSNTEFKQGKIEMKRIYLVIKAGVFGVGRLGPSLWISLKTGIFSTVVIVFLRSPIFVVTKIMSLDFFFFSS